MLDIDIREAKILDIELALLTITSRLLLVCYRDSNVIYVVFINRIMSLRGSSTRSS